MVEYSNGKARAAIERVAGDHSIYAARREEYATRHKVPFRVSPMPYELTPNERQEIYRIGETITDYFGAVDELYRTDDRAYNILNTGKPELFLAERPTQYLFVRPDLIITPKGFSICEVETSPFGLGLAEMLNKAYIQEGFETMVPDGTLTDHVQKNTPPEGVVVFSSKTSAYRGQLAFLADNVFSGQERLWGIQNVIDSASEEGRAANGPRGIYRGFYLGEYTTDSQVRLLLDSTIADGVPLLPSPTPHMEEKAVLAFLWDKRFEERLRQQLGDASFNHLRSVVPPTWIVGQEDFFAPGLPAGIQSSLDLASLSRAKRTFVLKESGFGSKSSWGEGVVFLKDQSAARAHAALESAQNATDSLFVVQQFDKARNTEMRYEDADGEIHVVPGTRIRITPYYAMVGDVGKLVGIKVTGCENTDYIHGTSISINTAVV